MRYCGREFSSNEIKQIRSLIKENQTFTRSRLSKEVCHLFQWLKPDGNIRDMSCRVAMLRMHRDGVIDLPAPTHAEIPLQKNRFASTCYKAANWINVGQTKGRGKLGGQQGKIVVPIKKIWVYPLHKKFRTLLQK